VNIRVSRLFAAGFLTAATALALTPLGAVAAGAQTPIGPNQNFLGLVNGSNQDPVVYTVCPGPSSPGQMGRVAAGQKLEVARVKGAAGYTGPFSQIHAWIVPVASTPPPPSVTFEKYGVAKSIPSTVRVPCDGTGQVEFSSCPYLAPCAYGWVPDYVTVTFENIAV
jgi:hypothetical protein